jgi:hypothetical protein
MKADIPPSERLMALFAGNEKAHGTHGEPYQEASSQKWHIKTTARTRRRPVTPALWESHLGGKEPLGVIPIRDDGTCSWGSIDVDEYDINLLDIIVRVEAARLPLVPYRSKSGGLHLFLFLTEAAGVQAALGDAAAALGLEGCEIFPKQVNLGGDGVGNWIAMPYLGTTFGGKLREQVGLRKTGAALTVEQFCALAEQSRTTLNEFVTTVPKRMPLRLVANTRPKDDAARQLERRCATVAKARSGERNNVLYREAVALGNLVGADELDEATVRERMISAGLATELPLPEVRDTVTRAIADGKLEPAGGPPKGAPVIVSWRKLSSDDPVWFLTIEGSNGELEIKRIDDITNFRRFADQCAKQLDIFFPPVKAADWASILREAKSRLVVEHASEDTTRAGAFHEHLEEFLTNRARGERREDILSGRPWEDDEKQRHEFRMRDLYRFIVRGGMRDVSQHECGQWVKKLGGGPVVPTPTTIKGKSVRLWFVPSEAAQVTPALDPPPVPEGKI